MADTKKSCTDSVDLYEDLLKCPGAKRLPGTGRRVFLAPRRYITALAKPQLEKAASMKDYLVIKESHTMAADKKFIVAYLATDKSNFSSESQGEDGSKTMLNKLSIVFPGTEEEQSALASMLLNEDVIALIPQRNGKCRQYGDDNFECSVAPSQSSGSSVTDETSTTVELSVGCEPLPPFYYGDIPTAEGIYSGETGDLKSLPA